MPDALKIPQLTSPQAAATRGTDGAYDGPQTSGVTTDSAAPGPSFAAVLKSKSATPDEDPAADVPWQQGAEDPSLLALIAGIAAPAENQPAVQLLARLTDGKQDTQPAILAEAAEVPAAIGGLAASAGAETELVAPSGATATVVVPQFAVPAALAASPHGVAVSPAPTLASLKAAAPTLPGAVVLRPAMGQAMGQAPQTAAGLPPPNAMFAASTANPAEADKQDSGKATPELVGGKLSADAVAGKPLAEAVGVRPTAEQSAETLTMEPAGEFRPLLERMTDRPSTIATQAASASQATLQQPAGAAVQVRLTTPFAQPGWTQEVDQTLNWIVTTARQQADLVLNPPELGRIEVTLVVKGDEVSASFASPHQAVREAIEESMIRLRESLADAGINLGQTHVGRESSRDAPFAKPEGVARQSRGMHGESGLAPTPGSIWVPSPGRGMVDVFA